MRVSQLRKLRECEQVAAVCYRVRRGSIEFLLVQTRGGGRWTFPKGSTEPGLTHAQAAALEALEEAGVHGRIEEVSFASYTRRPRGRTNGIAKNSAQPVAVETYLCEVLRLRIPKESKRNRTWFSPDHARRRLREGRNPAEGAGLARVLNRAVQRIRQLQGRTGMERQGLEGGYEKVRGERLFNPTDPLHKVKFEFAEAYGRSEQRPALIGSGRAGGTLRQSAPSAEDHTKVLCGDILQFDLSRNKKVKALGTGSHHS